MFKIGDDVVIKSLVEPNKYHCRGHVTDIRTYSHRVIIKVSEIITKTRGSTTRVDSHFSADYGRVVYTKLAFSSLYKLLQE